MLSLAFPLRIFVAREPVDFRKSHDGLIALVRDSIQADPFSGHLFTFFNRRRDRIKLLAFDRNGFWLHYKRLEQGTFQLPTSLATSATPEISRAELAMLLEGIDLKKGKIRPHFADVLRSVHQRSDANEQHRILRSREP